MTSNSDLKSASILIFFQAERRKKSTPHLGKIYNRNSDREIALANFLTEMMENVEWRGRVSAAMCMCHVEPVQKVFFKSGFYFFLTDFAMGLRRFLPH